MGMTMTQKILARAAGLAEVHAGDLIEADLDLVLGNDITSPVAIHEMDRFSSDRVFDKDKIALVMDHFIPNKDIKSAEHCKCVREYAMKHDITNYFDVGQMGIEHALLPEKGLVTAGDVVIGADSHTCTYGALGAFSTGVGSTDMAAGMATGKAWFKVPAAIRVNVTGNWTPETASWAMDAIQKVKNLRSTADGFTFEAPGDVSMPELKRITIGPDGTEAKAESVSDLRVGIGEQLLVSWSNETDDLSPDDITWYADADETAYADNDNNILIGG